MSAKRLRNTRRHHGPKLHRWNNSHRPRLCRGKLSHTLAYHAEMRSRGAENHALLDRCCPSSDATLQRMLRSFKQGAADYQHDNPHRDRSRAMPPPHQ